VDQFSRAHHSANFEKQGDGREGCHRVNVGETERIASAGVGAALVGIGLSRGSLTGLATAAIGGCLVYRGLSGHCSLYKELGINTAARRGRFTSVPSGRGIKIDKSVVINRPAEELFRHWRDLERLPQVMSHLESVTENGDRSHWKAKAPLGMSVEWDAELHNERFGEMIAWRSLPGSEIDTAGSVHFTPTTNGRGTEVRVVLKYDPPAGAVGAALSSWLGQDPEKQIAEDLQRFKRAMETAGSVV
jgi:uncharacterized membrane protein